MNHQVLLAGDDTSFFQSVAARLHRLPMQVRRCSRGDEVLALAADGCFEAAIVERQLCDMDALDLCRALRSMACAAAIFVCADVDLAIDAVLAHEAGADDFLLKSLELIVIEAKLRRGLRRFEQRAAQCSTADPDKIVGIPKDIDARDLTRFEERLLCALATARGEVVSVQDLIDQLWGRTRVEARTLYEHVSTLRAKISRAGWSLINVRGKGYRLERSEPALVADVANAS